MGKRISARMGSCLAAALFACLLLAGAGSGAAGAETHEAEAAGKEAGHHADAAGKALRKGQGKARHADGRKRNNGERKGERAKQKGGGTSAAEEADVAPHYVVNLGHGARRLDDGFQDYTYAMCAKYGIEEHYGLILAQMCAESGYEQGARSPAGNYGYMQVSPGLASYLGGKIGVTNIYDPAQNIEAGVYIMSEYLKKYGDVQRALVCYNCGESSRSWANSYSSYVVSLARGMSEDPAGVEN